MLSRHVPSLILWYNRHIVANRKDIRYRKNSILKSTKKYFSLDMAISWADRGFCITPPKPLVGVRFSHRLLINKLSRTAE